MRSSAGLTPGSKLNDTYGSLLNNLISGTPGAPTRKLALNNSLTRCQPKNGNAPTNANALITRGHTTGATCSKIWRYKWLPSTYVLADTVYVFAVV